MAVLHKFYCNCLHDVLLLLVFCDSYSWCHGMVCSVWSCDCCITYFLKFWALCFSLSLVHNLNTLPMQQMANWIFLCATSSAKKQSQKTSFRSTLVNSPNISNITVFTVCLFDLILYVPVINLSVMLGRVFLGWTSTKKGLMCLAQGHNAETLLRLEPAALQSRVNHSTQCDDK